MIAHGESSTGKGLAHYLTRGKNETAEVWELHSGRDELGKVIGDWVALVNGTKVEKPVYHVFFRPSDTDPVLSREDWKKVIAIFEMKTGFEGQPRAVVFHHGEGQGAQGHVHVAFLRIKNGKAISNSKNYKHHEIALVEIEKTLKLDHVYSPHLDHDEPRRTQCLNTNAIEQGKQLNINLREVKAKVTELYQGADDGHDFVAALESEGYTLARGDRRSYVILDQAGGIYNLTVVTRMKVAELRKTLQDYPLLELPSVKEVRGQAQERIQRREQEQGLVAAASFSSLSDGFTGDEKPLLMLEKQKVKMELQKHQADNDALKRVVEEQAQKNEQKKNRKRSRGRHLRITR